MNLTYHKDLIISAKLKSEKNIIMKHFWTLDSKSKIKTGESAGGNFQIWLGQLKRRKAQPSLIVPPLMK